MSTATTQPISSTSNRSGVSVNLGQDEVRSTAEIVVWSAALVTILLLSFVGNLMVIAGVRLHYRLREERANIFLVNLSITDMASALIVMSSSLHALATDQWQLGQVWCDIVCAANYTLIIVSMTTLCLISLDRYMAVVHALHYHKRVTQARIYWLITFAWLQGLSFGAAPMLAHWVKYDYWEIVCAIQWHTEHQHTLTYVLVAFIVCFLTPGLVLIFAYSKVMKVAKSHNQVQPHIFEDSKYDPSREKSGRGDRGQTANPGRGDRGQTANPELGDRDQPVQPNHEAVSDQCQQASRTCEVNEAAAPGQIPSRSKLGAGPNHGFVPLANRVRCGSAINKIGHVIVHGANSQSDYLTRCPNYNNSSLRTVSIETSRLEHGQQRVDDTTGKSDHSVATRADHSVANTRPADHSVANTRPADHSVANTRPADHMITAIQTEHIVPTPRPELSTTRSDVWTSHRVDTSSGPVCKRRTYNASRKAIKSLLIVVLAFVVCMTPFSVTKLYKVIFPYKGALPGYINLIASLFQYCASAINPLIYGIFRQDFRTAFTIVFRRFLRRQSTSNFEMTSY